MPDLLPYNATAAERALSESAERISDVQVPIRDEWNPDTCPSNSLAWLAWAFSVDQWDEGWSDEQKRATIKASVEVHKRKGTIGAVRKAVAAIGLDARIQEWFNQTPPGAPFTFAALVTADQDGVSQSAMAAIIAVIDSTKNLRSHLSALALTAKSVAGPCAAVAAGVGSEIHVTNYVWRVTVVSENTICI